MITSTSFLGQKPELYDIEQKTIKNTSKIYCNFISLFMCPGVSTKLETYNNECFFTKNFGEYTLLRSLESRLVAPLLKNDAAYKTGRGQNISAIYHVKLAVTTPKNQKSLFQSSLSSVSALLSIIKKLNTHSTPSILIPIVD